ncbi:hypothetical protein EJ06DRAFT_585630 [Trichodelitschia bisporula]|uniref:C2H2 type zinc finger domain protein n=1 Tax=Trichodelitschia bisporula TaxID=703511 RepID=A0A6G1HJ66_9PEZI|nr:hypothetical protein EJ06DRAFT_585630 [Trichodelitschia bisporula]
MTTLVFDRADQSPAFIQKPDASLSAFEGLPHTSFVMAEFHSPPDSADAGYACSLCSSCFKRSEHLSRHMLSHKGSKPHVCTTCGKSFTRRDTLARHMPIHSPMRSDRPGSIRVSKACVNCARMRLRCDGVTTCTRCRSKGLHCVYVGRSRKRIAPMDTGEPDTDMLDTTFDSHLTHLRSRDQDMLNPLGEHTALENGAEASGFVPERMPFFSRSEDLDEQSESPSVDWMSSTKTTPGSLTSPATEFSVDHVFSVVDCITSSAPADAPESVPPPPVSPSFNIPTWMDADSYHNPLRGGKRKTPHQAQHPAASRDSVLNSDASTTTAPERTLNPGCNTEYELPETPSDTLLLLLRVRDIPVDILEAENFGHVESIGLRLYDEITSFIQASVPGADAGIPSMEAFDCFVQLYFEHFHPTFPMLHKPTFDPSRAPWQLVLAMASIGCRYSRARLSVECVNAMQELVRRAISRMIETDETGSVQWLSQTLMLNIIGMTFGGSKRLLDIADSVRNAPATVCRRSGLLRRPTIEFTLDPDLTGPCLEERWREWVRDESRRRLGFCAFLTDAHFVLYLDGSPCMAVPELQQPLPCSEPLWDAPNARAWRDAYLEYNAHGPTPPLMATLGSFRHGAPLHSHLGAFARLITVYASYGVTASLMAWTDKPLHPYLAHSPLTGNSLLQTTTAVFAKLNPFPPPPVAPWRTTAHPSLVAAVDLHTALVLMVLTTPRDALLAHAHAHARSKDPPPTDSSRWTTVVWPDGPSHTQAGSSDWQMLWAAPAGRFGGPWPKCWHGWLCGPSSNAVG